jgi:hypothetical protein
LKEEHVAMLMELGKCLFGALHHGFEVRCPISLII